VPKYLGPDVLLYELLTFKKVVSIQEEGTHFNFDIITKQNEFLFVDKSGENIRFEYKISIEKFTSLLSEDLQKKTLI
jgi:hypothetical protein